MDRVSTFTKVHHNRESVTALLAERILQPRDLAVLYCMVEVLSPGSGKVLMTTAALAKQMRMDPSLVTHSISRLKAARVVVNKKDRDGGYSYFRINPRYASVGSDRQRAMHWKDFAAAVQEELDSGGLAA